MLLKTDVLRFRTVGLLVWHLLLMGALPAAADRPNILLILADDSG